MEPKTITWQEIQDSLARYGVSPGFGMVPKLRQWKEIEDSLAQGGVTPGPALEPKARAWKDIQNYLDANTGRLAIRSVEDITADVRSFAYRPGPLTLFDVNALVSSWRAEAGPPLAVPAYVPPTPGENKLIANIKSAVQTLTDGVTVKSRLGEVNASVTGLTVDLLPKKSVKVGIGPLGGTAELGENITGSLDFDGTLSLEIHDGPFDLFIDLAKDRWEMRLVFPNDDDQFPDASKIGDVFREAEKGLRGIAKEAATFRHLRDVERIKKAVEPHMKPVKEGVKTAASIMKPKTPPVGFSLSVGSPDPLPGQEGRLPPGVQGKFVLTLSL